MVEHSSDPARAVLRQSSHGGCAALEAGGRTAAAFVLDINASHFVKHTSDCCLLHFVHLTFGYFVQIFHQMYI